MLSLVCLAFRPDPIQTGLYSHTKKAICVKFRIYEEEGLYYLCSENKGADQLTCVFVSASVDCWYFPAKDLFLDKLYQISELAIS